jgi:Glycosyl transferase family 4
MGHGAASLAASTAAVAFVAAAAISVAIIIVIRPWLQRIALAKPNARSSHSEPTPQGGGIAVIAATIIAAAGALYLCAPAASAPASLVALLGAVIVIAAVGTADDIRPIGVAPRFFLQAFSVALLIFALPDDLRVAPFVPLWLERLMLTVGGLWFVNLANFMDGTRSHDGGRSRADHRGLGDFRRGGLPARGAEHHQPRLVRRHARLPISIARSPGFFSAMSAACRSACCSAGCSLSSPAAARSRLRSFCRSTISPTRPSRSPAG